YYFSAILLLSLSLSRKKREISKCVSVIFNTCSMYKRKKGYKTQCQWETERRKERRLTCHLTRVAMLTRKQRRLVFLSSSSFSDSKSRFDGLALVLLDVVFSFCTPCERISIVERV